ncbi:MAG: ribose-5-phosphate isomerase [Brachybacterium tyrofermentans]|uniref:ribose-5-phosphate isomerase n=1 Tax=Brachybacterium tyrofermentans TaxID=47848 RepID=UPI000A1A45C9|nr:Ribose 5-phosphate isomerase B / Galactose 6-phosphate isomerase [Corynebacterium xerosis]
MHVHIGTDHAGFELKNRLVAALQNKGHEVTDHGAHAYDALDDYPPFCTDVGEAVVADAGSLGVVIGGSGNGEQIAANKVTGVRAALVWNEDTARLARQHNDANVISVGARQHSEDELESLIDLFLAEPFTGEERHQRRIDLMARYEETGGYGSDTAAAPTGA